MRPRRCNTHGRRDDAVRVLQIVSSTTFAGIERHIVNLTRELHRLGCIAEVACPPAADQLRAELRRGRVRVLPSSGPRSRWWPGAVARQILRDPPDVIHAHDGRSALTAALLGAAVPSLLIRTQHFAEPASGQRGGWRGRGSLAVHRSINRRLDGYIAVSRCVADAARGRHEIGHVGASVIPPAIALPSDDAVSRARIERARLDHPVVVFAGRLEEERCLDVLVRAMPAVREQLPRCQFVLAGSGAAEGGLRALAEGLGVADAITWTGWLKEPYAVLAQAHVYVNTWPWEGFGMAMAEAMALSMPVVAVDSGASSEMVEPDITGVLVPRSDPSTLADAIGRVLCDPERAAEMGAAARRRALSTYGAERTARLTLDLYTRLRGGVS